MKNKSTHQLCQASTIDRNSHKYRQIYLFIGIFIHIHARAQPRTHNLLLQLCNAATSKNLACSYTQMYSIKMYISQDHSHFAEKKLKSLRMKIIHSPAQKERRTQFQQVFWFVLFIGKHKLDDLRNSDIAKTKKYMNG